MAEAIHPRNGKDIAGHGGDRENRELDGDRRGLGGVRGQHGDDEQRELAGAEAPLGLQEGEHDADHQQIAGICEGPHPGDQQSAPAEPRSSVLTGSPARSFRRICSRPRLPCPRIRSAYHRTVAEVRECAQCGTPFTPRREHARFCSARCRMAWNREHAGVAAAPAVAIDWSVTAMTEAARRLAAAGSGTCPASPRPSARRFGGSRLSMPPWSATTRVTTRAPSRPGRAAAEDRGDPGRPAVRPQPAGQVRRPRLVRQPRRQRRRRCLNMVPAARAGPRRTRAAGTAVGTEPVPRLPGTARRTQHRPDLQPLHGVPRTGRVRIEGFHVRLLKLTVKRASIASRALPSAARPVFTAPWPSTRCFRTWSGRARGPRAARRR